MKNKSISKFICLILRHKPETIGISLDSQGWASTKELIDGINSVGISFNLQMLINIVNTDNKNRYSFNEDKSKIRANQGHSISIDLKLNEKIPP